MAKKSETHSTVTRPMIKFGPQPGPQEKFLSCEADIVFYGGAAGGGKTYSMLLEALRNTDLPDFGAVIFRRTIPEIKNEGGIFDESMKMYPFFNATPNHSELYWRFPSGSTISFAGLEHDKSVLNWQGAQICMIGFEELTHFTKRQFFYMLSRNRSSCGVRPYIRCTTNPDKKSWVRSFIDWWIHPKLNPDGTVNELAGYPIESRSGVIRYFIVENNEVIWRDSPDEFADPTQAKSFTFIAAKLTDNKILMANDPGYLANLKALPKHERDALEGGNWDAEATVGEFFLRDWFPVIKAMPANVKRVLRYWDRAASEEDTADYTAGIKLAELYDGRFVVMHSNRFRGRPMKVESSVLNTASQDGFQTEIGIEQDPGQAGLMEAQYLVGKLSGYRTHINKPTVNKLTRAGPVSSQAEVGNILVLEGPWNEDFFQELDAFPSKAHDDQVDALSGAFQILTGDRVGTFTKDHAELKSSGFDNRELEW